MNRQEVESYLASKMAIDPEEDERSRQIRLAAGLGRAGATIGAALGGIKADTGYYDQLEANAAAGDKMREARRFEVAQMLQKKFEGQDAAVAAAAKAEEDRAQRLADKAEQRAWQAEQNQMSREHSKAMAAMTAAAVADRKAESTQLAREKAINADVEQFGKAYASQSDAKTALKEIEDQLGFNLDDAQVSNGNIVVNGQTQDLPGVNLPFVGRVSAYDGDARNLAAAAAKVFNVTLRDRSGAAVTSQELDRLRKEFNAGDFSSEADLVIGMKAYKRALMEAINNTRSSFSPDAVAEFGRRGGDLSTRTPAIPNAGKKHSDGGTATAAPDSRPAVTDMSEEELKRELGL